MPADERETKKKFVLPNYQQTWTKSPTVKTLTTPGAVRSRKRTQSEISGGFGSEEGAENKSNQTMVFDGAPKFRKLNFGEHDLNSVYELDEEEGE